MKKGWVIGCGITAVCVLGCGGVITLLVMFVFNTLQQFSKPADEFLTKLSTGDTIGAYQSAASGLRTQQTQEQFAESAKKMRLTEYKSSSWTKFNMVNNQATLEGTVTLKDGSTLPVTVDLVDEGGWKVLGMKPTSPGLTNSTSDRRTVPPEGDLKKLINADMAEFSRAIKTDNFTVFHGRLSKQFQSEFTADDLKKQFREFVEKQIDLSAVEKVDPTLSKPATIDAESVLQVEGEYQTRPVYIQFVLKYVFQNGEWKLLGVNVKTKAAD